MKIFVLKKNTDIFAIRTYVADLVLTTSHPGARIGEGYKGHVNWLGRVFSLSGESKKYPSFVQKCGFGQVQGICGINCRHSFLPYIDGISHNPFEQYDELAYKLKEQRKNYMKFCEENVLVPQNERMKVARFSRSEAEKAVWGAKRYENMSINNEVSANDRFGIFTNNNKSDPKFYEFEGKSIDIVEAEICKLDYEVGVIFDNGKAVSCQLGTSDEIRFTKYQVKLMRGKDVTHNHPQGTLPSPEDLYLLVKNKANSFRTCGKDVQNRIITQEEAIIKLGEEIWDELYKVYGVKPEFIRR